VVFPYSLPYPGARQGRREQDVCVQGIRVNGNAAVDLSALPGVFFLSVFPRCLSNDPDKVNEQTGSRAVIMTARPIFHPQQRPKGGHVFSQLSRARNFSLRRPNATLSRSANLEMIDDCKNNDVAITNCFLMFMFTKFMFLMSQIILFLLQTRHLV